MSVKGSGEKSDCGYTQVVLNEVPDVGPHVEIDHGPMHGEEFWEKEHK